MPGLCISQIQAWPRPLGQTLGNFFLEGRILHPPVTKEVRNQGQKNCAKTPPPGTIIFKNPAKKTNFLVVIILLKSYFGTCLSWTSCVGL